MFEVAMLPRVSDNENGFVQVWDSVSPLPEPKPIEKLMYKTYSIAP